MNAFVSLKAAAESKAGGVSKETSFQVDPRVIEVEPGFNRPINPDHVAALKESARNGAIFPPVYVRVEPGRIIMVDGEHRWRAVMELIAEGVEFKSMSAIQFRGSDADRIAHLITSSQGHGLSPLEAGLQYSKLERMGWSRKDIAGRVGRSLAHVDDCLLLAHANTDVHTHIRAGQISGSTAAKIVKKHGTDAGKVIADGMVKAQSNGKAKVTGATIAPKFVRANAADLQSVAINGARVTLTFHTKEAAERVYATYQSKEIAP